MKKTIPWIDPYFKEKLDEKDGFLVGKNSKYKIIDGINNMISERLYSNDKHNKIS